MSSYPKPRLEETSDIYNSQDFYGIGDIQIKGDYVKKNGDIMSGNLSVPSLSNVFNISFKDGSTMSGAPDFENIETRITDLETKTDELITKTTNIDYENEETLISGLCITEFLESREVLGSNYLVVNQNISFSDGSTQYTAFTNNEKAKLTNIIYDENLLKTSITNNFYTSDIMTSVYSSINSQIAALNSNLGNANTIITGLSNKCRSMLDYDVYTTIAEFYSKVKCSDLITSQINSLNDVISSLQNQITTLQTQINNSGLSSGLSGIPCGTIISYTSTIIPDGFLKCDGSFVSQITYANLFAIIGHSFQEGKSLYSPNYFYLPDIQTGVFLSGTGLSGSRNYGNYSVGHYIEQTTMKHSHQYIDEGNTSKSVVDNINISGVPGLNLYTNTTQVADNTEGTKYTQDEIYDPNGTRRSDTYNRPYSVCVNYIIKY